MREQTNIDYNALEGRLTDPETPSQVPSQVLAGEAAAAYGRDLLLREYGSEDAIDNAIRRGRPSLSSAKRGLSPVVRGAISQNEFEAFRELERISGKKQSELVRQAVHQLLVAEKLVS